MRQVSISHGGACLPDVILQWILIALALLASLPSANTLQPGQTERGQKVTQILKNFFSNSSGYQYDQRVRPNYGGTPVEVGVTMQIISISKVSEVDMDFTSDFYFRQFWTDERLSFTKSPGLDDMIVGAEVAEKIWLPDTFFANEKIAYFHKATTFNTFLRISSAGEVLRSIRLTVTGNCPMDLRYFPMDRQSCTIEIESFGYTMRDIRYRWQQGKKSVKISDDVELPQFKVVNHIQKTKEVALSTGNYSRLICEIRFERSMGYYLIQIYIPAGLIVVISWVSFWLHRNATPARVALGVTTVLTMTTLMSSTNAALPKISYVKSIDVYLGTCFVMVFASLLEYAAVGYLGKRIAMRKTRAQQLAKLAEQHRQQQQQQQQQSQQRVLNEPHDTIMTGPDMACLKTVGSCQVCPAAMASHGHMRDTPTGFAMLRRPMDGTCCPGLPAGSCGVCPTATLAPQPQTAIPMSRQHSMHRSYSAKDIMYNTMVIIPKETPNISSFATGCHEVRLKMIHDAHQTANSKGKSSGSAVPSPGGQRTSATAHLSADPGAASEPVTEAAFCKNPNKLFGVSPSDIDKYSRVVFPVCFVCFNLMYWIIYLHISDTLPPPDEDPA